MPNPLSICLEDLAARDDQQRYVRCVALPGNEPGLALDGRGEFLWKSSDPAACQLWISADDRLILLRPASGVGAVVTVSRAGRSVEAPPEKPVVLLDQDEVRFADRAFRLHIHGEAVEIHAPTPLRVALRTAAGIAAAAAVAVTGSAALADKPIQVRAHPPKPVSTQVRHPDPVPVAAPDAGVQASPTPPIEVRVKPPAPPPRPPPTQPPPTPVPVPEKPKK